MMKQKLPFGPFWIITMVVMASALFPLVNSNAAPLKCEDQQGKSVLTDTPAQLQKCKPIDLTIQPEASQPPPQIRQRVQPPSSRRPQPAQPIPQPAPPDTDEQETKADQPDKELPIAVPLTKIGGSMVVQVLLNGTKSAHLIVDTGATMTVLSYDIGADLGLLSGSGVDLSTVNTAGGSVQVSMTKIDQIEVGEAKVENVQVAIHDLPDSLSGISGLLGMSFLKNFTVTLDSDRGFLYLTPRSNTK